MVIRAAAWRILELTLGRYLDRRSKRKQRKRQRRLDEEGVVWLQRLPEARSGCSDDMTVLRPSAQTEAPFFTRLPAEIRQHIYLYACCNNRVEISLAKPYDSTVKPFELTCYAAHLQWLLGFPYSCKLAYMEVARLIYESNTFFFPNLTAFLCFQRLSTAHHFHAIRTIHLQWEPKPILSHYEDGVPAYGVRAWWSCWQEIAEMKGLRSVTIDIVQGYPHYEEDFFEPLLSVARTVRLQVNVHWINEVAKEWPFTVNRGVTRFY